MGRGAVGKGRAVFYLLVSQETRGLPNLCRSALNPKPQILNPKPLWELLEFGAHIREAQSSTAGISSLPVAAQSFERKVWGLGFEGLGFRV